jgi:hypothetical protein
MLLFNKVERQKCNFFFILVKKHAEDLDSVKEMEFIKIMIQFQDQELISKNKFRKLNKKYLQLVALLVKVQENFIFKQIR